MKTPTIVFKWDFTWSQLQWLRYKNENIIIWHIDATCPTCGVSVALDHSGTGVTCPAGPVSGHHVPTRCGCVSPVLCDRPPAGCQVPPVLLLQSRVLGAQVGHLLLQLLDPSPLPLQQLLLRPDDPVQLLQILRGPAGVLGGAVHVAPNGFFLPVSLYPPFRAAVRGAGGSESRFRRNNSGRCAFYASPLFFEAAWGIILKN